MLKNAGFSVCDWRTPSPVLFLMQVGHGARGDVTILPTLVINNMQYRDLFCYDYNGEPSECGGVEDECFRDGAMDEQLLELSMPTPASARRSAR
ncbi:Os01g0231300 [Oryza sativa Japonica Group]|uniref:Os01g0231300 protein n=1 Tax=Oryza sativa subsp. japonica TaxID=39947 RepID=A0A0P0V0C2_ORYSJ|nr:Os01g0231300 [Oryza sativa Japonica Group]